MMALWLFVALLTKHLICDFPLQFPRHYLHKGSYGHWGGLEHAGIHLVGTTIALLFFPIALGLVVALAILDAAVHYHVDWAKMNINKHFSLTPTNSEQFWWLIGIDQYLHQLTYAAMIYIILS